MIQRADRKIGLGVMLVTHYFTTGPPTLLADFLRERIEYLVVILHPFFYAKDTASRVKVYSLGVKTMDARFCPLRAGAFRIGELLFYLRDFILTLVVALRLKKRFELYIGADSLNALAGILLKKMGLVKRVVLYEIDHPVKRFSNSLLNLLYHRLDIYCADRCDSIWDLSPRMRLVRRMYGWEQKGDKLIVVPVAYPISPKVGSLFKRSNIRRLVFVGHLKESQGLQLAIESMPEILNKIPGVRLIIIGTGPYENEIKRLIKELRMENHISFLGYINDRGKIEEIFCEGGVGIAPYMPDPEGITRYADPTKIKTYLACGLPVIVTDVPWIARIIKKYNAGVVIKYNKEEFIEAVLKLIGDENQYLIYREHALRLAKEYTPERVFWRALYRVFAS